MSAIIPFIEKVLTIIVPVIGTLSTVYLREYVIKRKLQVKTSPIDRSLVFINLIKICGQIKTDLKADGVYIAYFHNGDYYKNGLSIDKFTVVAEDYNTNVNFNNGLSYISKYQSITIQHISYMYHRLLTDNRCYSRDIANLKMIDNVYKEDCLSRNIKSTFSFLIKDENEKPIGFISIEYMDTVCFKKDNEYLIWKHQMTTFKNIKNITNYGSKS